jgi:hypothetical protein
MDDLEQLEKDKKKDAARFTAPGILAALKQAYLDPAKAAISKAIFPADAVPTEEVDPRVEALNRMRPSFDSKEADALIAKSQALRQAKEQSLGNPAAAPAFKEPTDEEKAAAELRRFSKTLDSLR